MLWPIFFQNDQSGTDTESDQDKENKEDPAIPPVLIITPIPDEALDTDQHSDKVVIGHEDVISCDPVCDNKTAVNDESTEASSIKQEDVPKPVSKKVKVSRYTGTNKTKLITNRYR